MLFDLAGVRAAMYAAPELGGKVTDLFFVAYIDPGSGALLLQALVAATVGGLAMFRATIRNIVRKLTGNRSDAE